MSNIDLSQTFTASFYQKRLWKLGADILPNLRIEGTYPWPPNFTQEKLEDRWRTVLQKHEILRTRLVEKNGQITQTIGNQTDLIELTSDFSKGEIKIKASPLVADKATLNLIAGDLLCRAEPAEEAPMQFADYASWQDDLLSSATGVEGVSYWKRQAIVTPEIQLRAKGARGKFTPRNVSRKIQMALTPTRGELLSLWSVVVARFCGASQVSIATAVDRRKFPELERAAGPYTAWLPITFDINPDTDWMNLARHADLQWKTNADNSEYFEAANHLDCKIGFEETEPEVAGMSEAFDFCISIHSSPGKITATLYYNSALYHEEDAERIISRYENLVRHAPNIQKVGNLPLISSEEKAALLSFNKPEQIHAKPTCIHYLIESQARRTPNRIAVVCGGISYSYKQLNERANIVANQLLDLGLKTETPVGIGIGRNADTVTAILAVLKAGCAYVPLDPSYPIDRLAYMCEEAKIPVVITSRKSSSRFETIKTLLIEEAFAAPPSSENPPHLLGGEELAYIIFTSGSTGQPKGVLIQHNTLVNSTQARLDYYKQPVGAYLMVSSFSFDSSVAGIFWTLVSGGTLVLPEDDNHSDPFVLKRLIQSQLVTHLLALPSLYNAILDAESSELKSLRTVIVAGEACTNNLVQKHYSKLSQCGLYNEYGPTEGTVWATAEKCLPGKNITIGKPIPNTQAYILEPDLNLTPLGLAGELCIGGAGIARGYLNRRDLESQKFVEDLFIPAPSRRIYRTGDLARFTESGEIEFLGRVDNQVKIRGHRIELEEIESVLCSLPGITEAVVLPQQNSEGVYIDLIAYVLGQASGANCRTEAAKILPEYMTPSRIVVLGDFPRTANGKVDRKALAAIEPDEVSEITCGVQPRSPVEERVYGIWKDVLRRDGFGIEDNFFNLGGHSLLAIQMMGRIKEEFQIELPLKVIFEKTTITGISESILELLLQESDELENLETAKT